MLYCVPGFLSPATDNCFILNDNAILPIGRSLKVPKHENFGLEVFSSKKPSLVKGLEIQKTIFFFHKLLILWVL